MTTEGSLRGEIVEVGRRMYARGYTASNDGNISVRLDPDRLLMTPKSVCKGFMTPDMMCITDLDGRKLQGDRDPSSETLMHLEVYRQRPDVQAVVHAHPPIATGFAVAGIPLTRPVLAEVLTTLGSIPIAEYATPSTSELPQAVRKYIKAHDGMLLANHGALTVGGLLVLALLITAFLVHGGLLAIVVAALLVILAAGVAAAGALVWLAQRLWRRHAWIEAVPPVVGQPWLSLVARMARLLLTGRALWRLRARLAYRG